MASRKIQFAPHEHYHCFGRRVAKQKLFYDTGDRARFLFLMLHLQGTKPVYNVSISVNRFMRKGTFMLTRHKTKQIIADRVVKLVAFTLMPNHFHIILEEHEEGGTVRYMQRLLTAYAKYFATKYNHSGHVFQGPFGATHITDNKQLLYTSAYVHLNPRELSDWEQKEHIYPWSSYQDYISINRWGDLLLTNIITEQFKDIGKYREAVEDSDAKTLNKAVGFPNY